MTDKNLGIIQFTKQKIGEGANMENKQNKNDNLSAEVNARDIAWKMFKKSGNINYYRLYSDLKKRDE